VFKRRCYENCLINQTIVVGRLVPSRVMESMIAAATLKGKEAMIILSQRRWRG
jgi:hypothetical protein